MDESEANALRIGIADLRVKVAFYESRAAHRKYLLHSGLYIFTALLVLFTFAGALQDAVKWEQLGAYTDKLDACVKEHKIPDVFCRIPLNVTPFVQSIPAINITNDLGT